MGSQSITRICGCTLRILVCPGLWEWDVSENSGSARKRGTLRGLWLPQAARLGGRWLGFLRSEAPRPAPPRGRPERSRKGRGCGRRMARRGWGRIPEPRAAACLEAAAEDDAFLPGPSAASAFFGNTSSTPHRRLRLFRGSVQDWGRQAWAG